MKVNPNMEEDENEELEKIKSDPKVQRAWSDSSIITDHTTAAVMENNDTPVFGITAVIFLVCTVLYFLIGWEYFPASNR